MSAEVAGPVTTHPQLLPEGDHSSVGGHGILESASSSLVGVSILGYPSGLADPLDSSMASEGLIIAESAIATSTTTGSSNDGVTSRQPPTAAEVTAAAFSSPTLAMALCPSVCLSVRASQVGVLLKRLSVGSHKQHRTIAQGL